MMMFNIWKTDRHKLQYIIGLLLCELKKARGPEKITQLPSPLELLPGRMRTSGACSIATLK